ncbi:MAG: methyl-accepting chemotaxis protein [Burkholderiaceae bacterium]|nr:MAG: methyl-accepting chemotaxis protein [Burkholderiaceae bacterium]
MGTKAMIAPGVRLMQRLQLRTKLGLVMVLAVAPLFWIGWQSRVMILENRAVAQGEAQGLQVTRPLVSLQREMYRLRELVHLKFGGEDVPDADLKQSADLAQAALSRLDQALQAHAEWGLAEEWAEQHKQLSELIAQRGGDTAAVAFGQFTKALASLDTLSLRVGEASGMLFDPVASSYFMVVLSVQDYPKIRQQLSFMGGKGAGYLASGSIAPAEMGLMNNVLAEYTERLDLVSWEYGALLRAGEEGEEAWQMTRAKLSPNESMIYAQFQPGATLGDLKAYVSQNREAVKIIDAQHDATMDRLSTLLDERARGYQRQLNWLAVVMGLGMLAMVYLLAAFFTSLRRAVRGISVFSKAVATGDLSQQVIVDGKDELAAIAV